MRVLFGGLIWMYCSQLQKYWLVCSIRPGISEVFYFRFGVAEGCLRAITVFDPQGSQQGSYLLSQGFWGSLVSGDGCCGWNCRCDYWRLCASWYWGPWRPESGSCCGSPATQQGEMGRTYSERRKVRVGQWSGWKKDLKPVNQSGSIWSRAKHRCGESCFSI